MKTVPLFIPLSSLFLMSQACFLHSGVAHGKGSYVFACGDMWEGEWKDGQPWKVGSLTCPLSANPQSQPAIWAAVGSCSLRADAFIQPLTPSFVYQQTPAAAAAATLRGVNFPLKTPGLPLSGESSMMAAEKQRSAFSLRPERRDVAALLIAGASQASLVGSAATMSRNSHRKHAPDTHSNVSAELPMRPNKSQPVKTKAHFKGRSEEKFRLLAAVSSMQIVSNSNAFAFSSSEKLRETLDEADKAQLQLRAKEEDTDANVPAAAASKHTASAGNVVVKTSKNIPLRNINEAWV